MALLEEAVAIVRAAGPGSERALGSLLVNLGSMLHVHGEDGPADRAVREAMDLIGGIVEPDHRTLLMAKQVLAGIMARRGDVGESMRLQREVAEGFRRQYSADHHLTLTAELNLAGSLIAAGRAREGLEQALAVREAIRRTLPEGDLMIGICEHNLSAMYIAVGELEQAREFLERALELLSRALPPEDPRLVEARFNLSALLDKEGRWEEAAAEMLEVVEVLQESRGSRGPDGPAGQGEPRELPLECRGPGRSAAAPARGGERTGPPPPPGPPGPARLRNEPRKQAPPERAHLPSPRRVLAPTRSSLLQPDLVDQPVDDFLAELAILQDRVLDHGGDFDVLVPVVVPVGSSLEAFGVVLGVAAGHEQGREAFEVADVPDEVVAVGVRGGGEEDHGAGVLVTGRVRGGEGSGGADSHEAHVAGVDVVLVGEVVGGGFDVAAGEGPSGRATVVVELGPVEVGGGAAAVAAEVHGEDREALAGQVLAEVVEVFLGSSGVVKEHGARRLALVLLGSLRREERPREGVLVVRRDLNGSRSTAARALDAGAGGGECVTGACGGGEGQGPWKAKLRSMDSASGGSPDGRRGGWGDGDRAELPFRVPTADWGGAPRGAEGWFEAKKSTALARLATG